MTITLRCLDCGFSFTVTYPTPELARDSAPPVTCGHCRSTHWTSHAA